MDLFALSGNMLKVYLGLVVTRDTEAVCVLSHSALSRKVRLSRTTVLRSLQHLHRGGWIQGQAGRWQITSGALTALIETVGDLPRRKVPAPCPERDHPVSCPENGHPLPGPCSEPGQLPVQNLDRGASSPTRTRTLWSSSYEEDSICTAVPPHPEGGLGGTEPEKKNIGEKNDPTPESPSARTDPSGDREGTKIPQDAYQRAMLALWQQIAPGHPEHPTTWFRELRQAFGREVPVAAFQQFADQGKTLANLAHPDSYPRYLEACCRTAQHASPASRKPVRSMSHRPPPTDDDYNQDLAALHQARRKDYDPAYDVDLAALHRNRRQPSRTDSPHAHPVPDRTERRRA